MGSTVFLGEGDAALVGGLFQPIRQAVATEAGQVHEVDVLDILAVAQMPDEPAEGGGLQLGLGLLVDVLHGLDPPCWRRRSRVRVPKIVGRRRSARAARGLSSRANRSAHSSAPSLDAI